MKSKLLLIILFFSTTLFCFSQDSLPKNYTGERIANYANGKIKEKRNYLKGKENGESIGYYESGTVMWKRNYTKGKLAGFDYEYYENGYLKTQTKCVQGRVVNIVEYDEQGNEKTKNNKIIISDK